jgi:uncharacterized membrane protein
MHGYYTYDHGPGLMGWLIFALLLALLAIAAYAALTRLARPELPRGPLAAPPPPNDDPLTVLRLRYARGEIVRDEFLQASADLGAPSPPGA